MSHQSAQFEFHDEFVAYLAATGVIATPDDYIWWMNAIGKHLNRCIGPAELHDEAGVQKLLAEVRAVDAKLPNQRLLTNAGSANNLQSILRKYAKMVKADFRGLFAKLLVTPTPVANDVVAVGPPARIKQTVHRIVRDTEISREIKRLYEFQCQICGIRLEIEPGIFYAEAHHLQPLGGEHQGPDTQSNLICLCPNHHALFDYFAIQLNPGSLKLNKHKLGQEFVDYHNEKATKGGNL